MAEGIFWIFLSFFSVLGLFSFVRILQNAFTARETQDTMVLIPVGSDAPSAELKIRAVMSDGWDSVLQNGEVACSQRIEIIPAPADIGRRWYFYLISVKTF